MNEQTADRLRAKGYRVTPQRRVILQVLQEARCHLTPIEITHRAQEKMPGFTEATVYRTLRFLTKEKLILETHLANGQCVYEIGDHLHHHLICRDCGAEKEISHQVFQEWYESLYQQTGYHVDSRHVTLFGTCPDCR